ncbi:MAG: serine O-acetyltransferase EpsC [Erysipelotrichaceae bacterium]|nr:serine O-acetyltransferase EpsC [Erysipelotrichaceae bacterium]
MINKLIRVKTLATLNKLIDYVSDEEITLDYLEEDVREILGDKSDEFIARLPEIRRVLKTDLQELYDGDPAADSYEVIILAYPGYKAIATYRIAHEVFKLGFTMIARIMSEHAHSRTGIDIHPGATIDEYFFIDHGTGIVIGETSIIGKHVKLYQGVTLGALSTRGGQALRGKKRHPSICDNVTIYANATVLGDVTIGEGTTIGGSVFITESTAPNSKVYLKDIEYAIK